jgi:thermitase
VHNAKQPLHKYKPLWFVTLIAIFLALSACSTTPQPQPTVDKQEISQLATISISATATKAGIEKLYGGKVIMFRPEAGFAILGFADKPGLSALATEPNAAVTSPEVSAQGTSAWGGGINAWGGGSNAWGSGTNAWGSGSNAWGSGSNAWGSGSNAWGSGANAWGSGNTTIPALPSENRFMFQQIRLPQAHTVSRNFGAGVKIAVIDTGIDLSHPLFTGRLAPSTEWKDFVSNDSTPQEVAGTFYGHGTGIAGLIVQTAPRATILPIRVLGPDGTGDVANIVLAIDWAIQKGANVINLSLGTDKDVASFKQAVTYAAQAGVYVVAAAGNEGSTSLLYPAAYMTTATGHEKMLSAGSFSSALLLSLFCNSGAALEYVAPGEFMTSAYPDLRVAQYTGSSFATPVVAGAVALAMGEASTSANKQSVYSYLSSSSVSLGSNLGKRIDTTNLLRTVPGFVTRKALLVVGSTTLSSGDSSIKSRMENLGYTVTVQDDDTSASSNATGKDVVIISASVSATAVNTKFRDVAVPVVSAEDGLYDDMKMVNLASVDQNLTTGQTQVVMGSTHPMAAGLIAQLPVYTSAYDMGWGKPAASAVKIATLPGDSTKALIFAYDKGATMVGLTAPARRAGFFIRDTGSTLLNTPGIQLFESAITWATSGN